MGAIPLVLGSLQVLQALLEAGTTAYAIVTKLQSTLETMKQEGRDPNQQEWDEMHALLQQARDELNSNSTD